MSDLAQQIADRLLRNGANEEGSRLAIKLKVGPSHFDKERDLGGWCRQAIINQIQPLIESETKRLREALQLVKDKKTSRWHPSDPVLATINSALASAEQQNTNKE